MTETNKKAEKPSQKEGTTKADSKDAGKQRESRLREIKIDKDLFMNKGPLHIPHGIKREGYSYHWMRSEKYRINTLRKFGYDYAYDPETGDPVRGGEREDAMFLLEVPDDIKHQLETIKEEIRRDNTLKRHQELSPGAESSGVYEKDFTITKKVL